MSTAGIGTSTDFSGLNDALKQTYEPEMQNAIVSDSELADLFETVEGFETRDGPDGKQVNISLLLSGGGATVFQAESDYLVTAALPSTKQASVNIKQQTTVIQMSGQTMRRVKQGPAAFATWADQALPLAIQRHVHHKDRALIGAGTGLIARVNQGTPSTSLVVDTPFGISTSAPLTQVSSSVNNFMVGDQLRCSANANMSSARTGVAVITNIDYVNSTIIIDALPTSTADNDYIALGDANVISTAEAMGLEGHIDDGTNVSTYQGLTRSSYLQLYAQILDSSTGSYGQVLSEDVVVKAGILAESQGAGKPNVLVTGYSGALSFWKSIKSDRQILDPQGTYTGGVDYNNGLNVIVGGSKLLVRKCRKVVDQRAYLIDTSTLRMYRVGKGRWDDTDGSIWNRVRTSTGALDAHFAVFIEEYNTACTIPQRSAKITKLTAA